MLGKLLKYEIKGTARMFLPFYAALILIGGFNRILFAITKNFRHTPLPINITQGISMTVYGLLICAIFVLTFIVMVMRFYKNLLGDEGYLMFTLPVPMWQQIASKLLICMLWFIVSVVITIASVLIMVISGDMIAGLPKFFAEFFRAMSDEAGIHGYLFILEILVLMLVGIAASILQVYASISIGQLWSKHKLLGSFAAYVAINIIMQIVTTVSMLGAGTWGRFYVNSDYWSQEQFFGFFHGMMGILILWCVLFGGLFYFVTHYLLKHNLNLE